MTTAEVRALRERLITQRVTLIQNQRSNCSVTVSEDELWLLENLLRSHILWRDWLLPGE